MPASDQISRLLETPLGMVIAAIFGLVLALNALLWMFLPLVLLSRLRQIQKLLQAADDRASGKSADLDNLPSL